MRLAVSNIAWTASEDDEVLELLRSEGLDSVEIAPSRVFTDPTDVSMQELHTAASRFADAGIRVLAFQSLLFTRPDAALFGTGHERDAFEEHLRSMLDLASRMGVRRLVLGSPKNRRVPDSMSRRIAERIAVETFGRLAEYARSGGSVLCIEPNPPVYGCNFVTTPDEGMEFVDAVGDPGFGLHLDVAGTFLAGVDPVGAVQRHGARTCHFHISGPQLGEIDDDVIDHGAVGAALRRAGYDGTLSIEMRAAEPGSNAGRVRRAVRLARERYF